LIEKDVTIRDREGTIKELERKVARLERELKKNKVNKQDGDDPELAMALKQIEKMERSNINFTLGKSSVINELPNFGPSDLIHINNHMDMLNIDPCK
jgi:hypothetical protein